MDTSSTTTPAFSTKLGSFKKAVKSLQKTASGVLPRKPAVVCWGFLGVGEGTIRDRNINWMVADYCWWTFLLQHAVGYSDCSRFHVLRSVLPFFPDGRGIYGGAACDRLRFPLHPSLLAPLHSTPNCSAAKHRDYALRELSYLAGLVKSRDTLVLLLIGHGGVSDGVFEFHVSTGLGVRGEASLSKSDLELALKRCKARVLIVCNACYSGLLQSKLWTLVCAAGPGEPSDALAQSGSGVVRGGVFASCDTRQIAKLGLQLPRPRAVKRSVTAASISIYPENDITERQGFFGMLHGGSSPPPSYSSPPPLPTMPAKFGLLALVYTSIIHSPHTTDVLDTRWCVQYLQHLSDPSVHASPFRGAEGADFHLTLRCRNVQCVMVQHLAQTLRWWEGEVTPFVVRPLGGDMWAKKKNGRKRDADALYPRRAASEIRLDVLWAGPGRYLLVGCQVV